MPPARIREEWLAFWREADRTAREIKESQAALLVLSDGYRRLTDDERSVVNELLAEALATDDESARFDALALSATLAACGGCETQLTIKVENWPQRAGRIP